MTAWQTAQIVQLYVHLAIVTALAFALFFLIFAASTWLFAKAGKVKGERRVI